MLIKIIFLALSLYPKIWDSDPTSTMPTHDFVLGVTYSLNMSACMIKNDDYNCMQYCNLCQEFLSKEDCELDFENKKFVTCQTIVEPHQE